MPRICCLLIVLTGLIGVSAADQAQLRADLQAVVAQRDAVLAQLNERLAADAAKGPLVDFKLEAAHMYRHRPLVFEIFQRGLAFYGGPAHLTSFNHGAHSLAADQLTRDGDRVHGPMRVTLNPDQWIPADRKPRYQDHQIDLQIVDGQVTGTYRYTGHLGPDKDQITGTATVIAAEVVVTAPTGIEETEAASDLAWLTAEAYQQFRAAAMALRYYPVSYERCLSWNRCSLPDWPADVTIEELTAYTERARAIAEAYRIEQAGHDDFAAGFCGPDDERFGPFFDAKALPVVDGVASLPADHGRAGPQRWQFIGDWTITGPFPAPRRIDHIDPQVPEWIPAPSATFTVKTADFSSNFIYPDWLSAAEKGKAYNSYQAGSFLEQYERPEVAQIHDVPGSVRTGRWEYLVYPPRWMVAAVKVPLYGAPKSSWFARAPLHAPTATKAWVEIMCLDAGQLWVNDRLAWHSLPDLEDRKKPKVSLVAIDLRQGVNDIMLRVRNDDPQSGARLLICTGGAPKPGTTAADSAGVAEAVHFNFRGNGTGSFPAPAEGRPPLAWDLAKGTNVRWSQPLASYSHANPVIVGDKVLTNSEPHTLICFDKMTGKELWRVDSSLAEFMKDDEKAPANEAFAKLGKHNEHTTDPNLAALNKERKEIELKLRDQGERMKDAEKTKLKERSKELQAQANAITGNNSPGFKIISSYGAKPGGWHRFTGFTMASPVTDGTHVWVKYATGVAACYDLDGNRQWMVRHWLNGDIPNVSSPLVIGDVLVLEGGARARMKRDGINKAELEAQLGARPKQDLHFIIGLDAATGKELWARPVKCGIGGYGTPDGPRAMRLPLEAGGHVDVIVTQRYLLRASDGKVLNDATGTRPGYAGVVYGDQLWNGSQITRFWAESPDQVGLRHLLKGDGGWSANGCVLAADGRLYGNPDSNMRANRSKAPWQDLVAVDARTGVQTHRTKPVIEGIGEAYTAGAACGEYVYLIDTGAGGHDSGKGRVLIVKAGDPPQVLARCELDALCYATPTFDGQRMYVRTRKSLHCFETTTDAGRELEYELSVQELFKTRSRLPLPPSLKPVPDLAPPADFTPAEGVPVVKLHERLGPDRWLRCGPFAYTKASPDHLADLGGAGAVRATPGLAVGDKTFTALDPAVVRSKHALGKDIYSREYWNSQVIIDLTTLSGGKGQQVDYFYTVIEVTRPRVVRLQNPGKGYRAWLAGEAMKDDQVVRLEIGHYPLMLRTEVGKVPPFAKAKKFIAKPQFIGIDDPADKLRSWGDTVRPFLPRIKEVLDRRAGTPAAFDAEVYLRKLGVTGL